MTVHPKLEWLVYTVMGSDAKSCWEGVSPDGSHKWRVTWNEHYSRWVVYDWFNSSAIEGFAKSASQGRQIAEAMYEEWLDYLSKNESLAHNLVGVLLR